MLPAAALSSLFVDDDTSSAWSILFGVVTLFGFMVAGYGAGRIRNDTPMLHGATAAALCYVVVQIFGVVRRLASGESINPAMYPLTALLAATMGVAGALFADWYRRKTLRA